MEPKIIIDNNVCHEISLSSVSELAKFQMEQLNNIKSRFDGLIYIRTTGVLGHDFINPLGKVFYNQKLKDPHSNCVVELNIGEDLVQSNNIKGGELVEVTGFLIIYFNRYTGGFFLRIKVTNIKIQNSNEDQCSIAQVNQNLLAEINNMQINHYDFPNKIHDDRVVKVALIHPKSTTTVEDFYDALGERSDFACKLFEVNISDPDSLINTFNDERILNADLVAIIRGGGDGFEVFNDIDVCKAFNDIKCHKIIGLGHKEHSTLLDLFADHVAATPSLLGIYLQRKLNYVDKFRKAIHWQREQQKNKAQEIQPPIIVTPQEDVKLPQIIKNQRIIMAMFAVMIILILWK